MTGLRDRFCGLRNLIGVSEAFTRVVWCPPHFAFRGKRTQRRRGDKKRGRFACKPASGARFRTAKLRPREKQLAAGFGYLLPSKGTKSATGTVAVMALFGSAKSAAKTDGLKKPDLWAAEPHEVSES